MKSPLPKRNDDRPTDGPEKAKSSFGPRHFLVAVILAAAIMVPIWGVIWWLLP